MIDGSHELEHLHDWVELGSWDLWNWCWLSLGDVWSCGVEIVDLFVDGVKLLVDVLLSLRGVSWEEAVGLSELVL